MFLDKFKKRRYAFGFAEILSNYHAGFKKLSRLFYFHLTSQEWNLISLENLDFALRAYVGFKGWKEGYFHYFFFNVCNEIFYLNNLVTQRYIFEQYFVKFLIKNFENSPVGTPFPVTSQKKVLSPWTWLLTTGSSKIEKPNIFR